MATDRVIVFDTTLRDGEQSPGATMTSAEKLDIARAIARLGVDVIEAGFPSASPDDWRAVRAIAETVGAQPVPGRPQAEPPIICGLARATERDIELAWTAVQPAAHPRIHTFLATSPIHREHKLRMTKEQVVERIRKMVAFAKARCADVEFSCEDAGRTEPEFLAEAVQAAIEAGATTINIPDTVGYTTPDEFGERIAALIASVPGIDGVVVSVHCHNDLGLATANTLAGVRAGARQVEVTINGIGERAGNTALEEVVMALEVRADRFGPRTGIDTTQIARASRLVASVTGLNVQAHKAIVGANAFSHEAGIHQDGMLKHAGTYEIMRPETVGLAQSRLVLGKHSGRHAFSARLIELGHVLDAEALDRAFASFKELADKKKFLTDADLEAIVASEGIESEPLYELDGLQVACGSMGMPTATVRLRGPDGGTHLHAAVGTGPVDAAFKAIDAIIAQHSGRADNTLLEYQVQGVTEGIDAIGEVSVRIQSAEISPRVHAQGSSGKPTLFHGHGADTDIIVASAKAYLTALNRLLHATLAARTQAPIEVTTPTPTMPDNPGIEAGVGP
ncbi:MAG: 2-isopropylmalate synthase [Deltaproteobacteria bacterium]|nr:2-isopropylmalate synthase [Deltaproteobacteria bacterium]